MSTPAPLRLSVDVSCAPADAFAVWTEHFAMWWPADHTVTGDPSFVALEPRLGGRIYERGADGTEHEWGEITVWEPPERLGYLWHLRRDRRDATEVEISFRREGPGTRVEIQHRGWERLGTDAEVWRTRNRAGWSTLLPHYVRAVEEHTRRVEERQMTEGTGTQEDPWRLSTAPGSSSYTMWRDEESDPPLLVCQVGTTKLTYLLRVLEDLPAWLREQDDWVPLGAADEKKDPAAGTVEAWGRSEDNPVGGWYGQRRGYRGRLGMYLPPLLEALGLVELTHEARNNRTRAR